MSTRSVRLVGILVAAALAAPAAAHAQRPTVSDIAACNEEAQAKASPSASPGPPTAPPGRPADPPAAPRPPADAPPLTRAPGTQTDPSGSIVVQSPDPLLEGMATEGIGDRGYRTAYRECMAGRLKR
jgi:hypothetical protein